jgi:non-ribosomal peptide synthetase component F
LSPAEQHQALFEWNDSARSYDLDTPYSRLVEAQVERGPDRIAAACAEEQLSYRVLNDTVNRVARVLISEGIGTDDVVALLGPRGTTLMAAILGTLKAGAAYLPLDPAHPARRYKKILEQSEARLILRARESGPALDETLSLLEAKPAAIVLEDLIEYADPRSVASRTVLPTLFSLPAPPALLRA